MCGEEGEGEGGGGGGVGVDGPNDTCWGRKEGVDRMNNGTSWGIEGLFPSIPHRK